MMRSQSGLANSGATGEMLRTAGNRNGLLSHSMASQAIDYFSVLSWMVISLVACDTQVAPG